MNRQPIATRATTRWLLGLGIALAASACGPPPKVEVDTLRVVSWAPNQGSRCIAVTPGDFRATATFSDELETETVSAASFYLEGPDGAVEAATTYDSATQTIELLPLDSLEYATDYELVASQEIMGLTQGQLVLELRSSFETVAAAGCYDAN